MLLLQVEELELCGKNSFPEFISPRRIGGWKEEGAGKEEEEKRRREKEGKEEKGEREGCEIQMSLGMVMLNSISELNALLRSL